MSQVRRTLNALAYIFINIYIQYGRIVKLSGQETLPKIFAKNISGLTKMTDQHILRVTLE